MALGLNGINNVNTNIFATPADLVTGNELTQVANKIFGSVNTVTPSPFSFNTGISGTGLDVSLYGTNASSDVNAIKLAATNTASLDVSLSNNALSAINSLNAKAMSNLVNNIAQFRNGIVHVNNEKADFSGLNNISQISGKPEIFEAMNLSKDRKGSNAFYVPRNINQQDEKEDGLNILA